MLRCPTCSFILGTYITDNSDNECPECGCLFSVEITINRNGNNKLRKWQLAITNWQVGEWTGLDVLDAQIFIADWVIWLKSANPVIDETLEQNVKRFHRLRQARFDPALELA